MRLPAPRERRRGTALGEPFLRADSSSAPADAEPESDQPTDRSEPQSLDPFRAMVNLFNACQRAEAEIAEIEETLAVDPDALPPEAIVTPAQKLLAQTQSDIERLPPGKASERVIKTAQREGLAVSGRVLEADARARQRFTAGAINDAADRLAARVAEDPGALKPSLKMLNDLIEAADLDPSDKRLIAANLEAGLRDAASGPSTAGEVQQKDNASGAATRSTTDPISGVGTVELKSAQTAPVSTLGGDPTISETALVNSLEAVGERETASRLLSRMAGNALRIGAGALVTFFASTTGAGGRVVDREFDVADGSRVHIRFVQSETLGRLSVTRPDGHRLDFAFLRGQGGDDAIMFREAVLVDPEGESRVLSRDELGAAITGVSEQLKEQGVDLRPAPAEQDAGTSILPARRQKGKQRLTGDDEFSGMDERALEDLLKKRRRADGAGETAHKAAAEG